MTTTTTTTTTATATTQQQQQHQQQQQQQQQQLKQEQHFGHIFSGGHAERTKQELPCYARHSGRRDPWHHAGHRRPHPQLHKPLSTI